MGNLYTSTTFMEHNSHPDYKYEMDAPRTSTTASTPAAETSSPCSYVSRTT